MAGNMGKDPVWDNTPQPPPPAPTVLKGGVVYGSKDGSSGFGNFMRAVGRGLGTVAKAGLNAMILIGEQADDLFPGHYRDYAVFDDFNPTDDMFANDPYLTKYVFDSKQNQDLLQQMDNGEALSSSALKQLRHITDQVNHRAKTDAEKFAAKALETNVLKALVGNQLMNLPKTKNNKINYNNVEIEEQDAPAIVKRDLHLLFEKDRRITPQEIKEWPKMEPPQKQVQNVSPPPTAYKSEPGAQDLTLGTAFDIAAIFSGVGGLTRYAAGKIATKQVASQVAKQAAKEATKPIAIVAGKDIGTLKLLRQKGLNEQQIKKYKEFVGARGKTGNVKIEIYNLPNGGKAFQTQVPARHIRGSSTVFQQQIDASGKTVTFGHTTYASNGKIVHTKQKYPVEVQMP